METSPGDELVAIIALCGEQEPKARSYRCEGFAILAGGWWAGSEGRVMRIGKLVAGSAGLHNYNNYALVVGGADQPIQELIVYTKISG